jgi:hypothetical protein
LPGRTGCVPMWTSIPSRGKTFPIASMPHVGSPPKGKICWRTLLTADWTASAARRVSGGALARVTVQTPGPVQLGTGVGQSSHCGDRIIIQPALTRALRIACAVNSSSLFAGGNGVRSLESTAGQQIDVIKSCPAKRLTAAGIRSPLARISTSRGPRQSVSFSNATRASISRSVRALRASSSFSNSSPCLIAVIARSSAIDACRSASANKIWLKSCSMPSALDVSPSNIPSAPTPITTTMVLIHENRLIHRVSEYRTTNRPEEKYVFRIGRCSTNSSRTPIATIAVNIKSPLKNPSRKSWWPTLTSSSSRRSDSAETSIGRNEKATELWLKVLAVTGTLYAAIVVAVVVARLLGKEWF